MITANESSGLHTLVKNHGVGEVVPAENQDALNNAIENLLRDSTGTTLIREKARAYAEQFLNRNEIMIRFQKDFL